VRAATLTAVLVLASCEGSISGARGTDPTMPATPSTPLTLTNGWPSFAPNDVAQLRRLTTEQYVASVQTLLGVSTTGLPGIEPVSPVAGFAAIGASTAVVSSGGIAHFEDAARFLASATVALPAGRQLVIGCVPSGVNDTACFQRFVTQFGQRAFRRPLSSDEVAAYTALVVETGTRAGDPLKGIEATISAFLQSPNFLYLAEVGEPDPTRPGWTRYTSWEMASRLSYFLLNDTPDDQLLAAAASGSLTSTAELTAQAQRLLASPKARGAVRSFFTAMLRLDGLDTLSRPIELFPASTPTLIAAMKEEPLRTLEDLVFDSQRDYRSVFDQPFTFVNPELARFYGLPVPSGSGFSKVDLPSQRLGLLSQAGVLAVHDHSTATSPTKRGLFVLTRLLCQPLALAPPANLVIPPPPTGVMTARQRLGQHNSNAVCGGCHAPMDTVGLTLEHFDPLGQYRERDHELVLDVTGHLGADAYEGEPGLARLLATQAATRPCLVQALYGSSVGRVPSEFDRGTFTKAVAQFDGQGGQVRALLQAITTSDGFRYAAGPN
jgi:Protein of unknown function (DUF1592)/Protein of unknown function (DUF1588)/Protein of unknown function (DUF1595)/Protein of unknown function (DUF1585)